MTDTAHKGRMLSDRQRARLRARLTGRAQPADIVIPRRADRARAPLSFAQEQLWFLSQLDALSAYGITLAVPLAGALDVPALHRALETLVARHEALRTVFAADGTAPCQIVRSSVDLPLPIDDLAELDSVAADNRAGEIRRTAAESAFDLTAGPLFRVRLLRFAPDRHELLVSLHHIVSDGWSSGVLLHELAMLYEGFATGAPVSLPELPIQYADYAAWQREQLQGTELERLLAYWRPRLAGSRPAELPADRPRPPLPSFRAATAQVILPAALAADVRAVARESRATLFMTLLAAFKVLLFRHTGQADLVVGTVSANRTRAELNGVVGCCANLLAIRTTLACATSFREVVAQVRDACFGAYEHQELPFARLVEECAPDRDTGRNPLFQIAFSALHSAGELPSAAGVRFGPGRGVSETVRFDIEVQVAETADATTIAVAYNTDLFDGTTITRLVETFSTLLAALVADPVQPLDAVTLMRSEQRAAVLDAGTGARSRYPRSTLGGLFASAAERHADAIAVEEGSRRWTYRAIAERAGQLAAVLRQHQVGPNVPVGVWLERGAELVLSLVGTVTAGGAYVPLDPKQPAGRAADILRDVGTPVVVTTRALAPTLPEGPWAIVTLDDLADAPRPPVAPAGTADDLAYVIYTSGSTGRPKGVAVPHRAVARLVCDTDYVALGSHTVMAQAATAAFDAATFEIWGALLHGGRLVIVPTEVALSPAALAAYLQRTGVTTLFLTTALVHQIGRELPGALNGVGDLLFGGEAVEPRWIAAIRAAGGPRRLLHVYGPTETTTFASWYPVEAVSPDAATIPIGGPIAETDLYVLDGAGQPAPPGMPGELYIGGDGLARGYVGAPRLTAERFVPDGVSGAPGARLYRSGDLVRWREPGVVEFIGRRDGQVKIRGNRIELGEVDAALAAVPDVGAAIVTVRGEGNDRRLVGYVTPTPGADLRTADVRDALKARLPAYMIPSAICVLPAFPLNANGKIDRAALPPPDEARSVAGDLALPRSAIEDRVASVWRDVLGVDTVGVHDNFFDLGGHSLLLVRVQAGVETAIGRRVPLVTLFQYPTVAALAAHLEGETVSAPVAAPATATATGAPIAIIGIAGRFPGAADVETFWEHLCAGAESIRRFTPEELAAAGVPAQVFGDPSYVPARGALADVDLFDASLFGYSPREAALLDPQQRLMLECAWEALEGAGYAPGSRSGLRIGVYAGTSASSYLAAAGTAAVEGTSPLQLLVSTDKDFLASRISYKLELTGPAVTVQTACSTSLVAVHTACQALRAGDCDIALAGGVSVTVPVAGGYRYTPEGIASPDGHCRPFDAQAAGTVAGNGVGLVVLKRLTQALADGDLVHAVVRGTAINNDGADKVGFTAPSVTGQAAVIAAAQAAAGVSADTIGYVEAHGTGTALGDPVEVAALRQVFGDRGGRPACALASVKSNVGHLDAAAGVTGLIKTTLALAHRVIPPSLHFSTPNPQIDLGPFYVPTRLTAWVAPDGAPRRAGVSSFGMGGTNAHAILEEAPPRPAPAPGRPWHIVPVAAQTPAALEAAVSHLTEWLEQHPGAPLPDVAYTLQVGRAALGVRRAAVGADAAGIAAALRLAPTRVAAATAPPLIWMFPGQGTQLVGMAREVYEGEPVFRAELDACAAVLTGLLDEDLRAVLYPDGSDAIACAAARLAETTWAQVALVAVEISLAALWRSWGFQPAAVIGHSVGELAAACVAGVLTREAALQLTAMRGRLMQGAPRGGMLAVAAAAEELASGLGPDLCVAAINGAAQCVIAGPSEALDALQARLTAEGRFTHRLATAGAFHSPLMAGVVAPLTDAAAAMASAAPRVPWISSATAALITDAPAAAYWGMQVTSPVRWIATVAAARAHVGGTPAWLELGPGHTLASLVRGGAPPGEIALATLDGEEAAESTARAIAELWANGIGVDWAAYHAGAGRQRVRLPTYPFQRQRYWLESASPVDATRIGPAAKRPDTAQWLYTPCWRQTASLREVRRDGEHCLLFMDRTGARDQVRKSLEARGAIVTTVAPGDAWQEHAPDDYTVDGASMDDCARLLHALAGSGRVPARIVHAWTAGRVEDEGPTDLGHGVRSVLALARAIGSRFRERDFRLIVVASGTQLVRGDEPLSPERAAVLGACRVIPQELPRVRCRVVDVEPEVAERGAAVDALAVELLSDGSDAVAALRGARRWTCAFEPIPEAPSDAAPPALASGATYLITGGLGKIGLTLARHLAEAARAQIILLSRSAMPPREQWAQWLDAHDGRDPVSRRIRGLRAIEEAGGRFLVVAADVSDRAQLAAALAQGEAEFGAVRGVIHAAGATAEGDFAALDGLDRSMLEKQFLPKIGGARNLAELLGERPLDFCVLMSSVASVLGGVGFAAYAAANAFLNAFAEQQASSGKPWTSVAWDGWMFDRQPAGGETAALAMTPEEGLAVFDRVTNIGARGTIVISTADLPRRLDRRPAPGQASTLSGAFVEPRSDTERIIARAWADSLGVEHVGAEDNFFELGGHSLLGLHMAPRLSAELGVNVSLRDLWTYPTVAQLAGFASAQRSGDGSADPTFARTLAAVQALSDEEVERLLSES